MEEDTKAKGRILIVDDEDHIRRVLGIMLDEAGYEPTAVESGEAAVEALSAEIYDAVLCDIRMPFMDGMEVLREIKRINPDTVVVMMTAFASVETAIEAMKQGAYDYISKPFKEDEILLVLEKALANQKILAEIRRFRREIEEKFDFSKIIGRSKPVREILDRIRRVADTKSTVLLMGESGTGKELFARAIHYNSPRRDRPLVTVNCGSIPGNLLESELFGHAKGAFTGADRVKRGLFEEADGSSLFLDEVGEMNPDLQVKLLRSIQEGEIRRLGENEARRVDARYIAATNRDLEADVEEGRFRADLFYRLNVVPVRIPALRERRDDIPLLARHFLDKYCRAHKRGRKALAPEAIEALMRNDWRGNVRELENAIEQAVVLSDGEVLTPKDLLIGPSPSASGVEVTLPPDRFDFKATLENVNAEAERQLIDMALRKVGGNRTRAAELLGIGRRTLLYKIKEHDIE